MATPPASRRSVASRGPAKQIPKAEAQEKVLSAIADGLSVEQAMSEVGRGKEAYRTWMKEELFNARIARLRDAKADGAGGPLPVPDFPEFCELLGQPLHFHQLVMWDIIEGREPRKMHPAFKLQRGAEWATDGDQHVAGRVICNLPPGHAKTTTFSINYSTWLIHKNPNIKIIVVCKDMGLATQILGAVKFRLVSPVYRELHARYAPNGGWKDPDQSWTQTAIYVQGKGDGEKDPTMQALGIGGRIYGARSDVIILDDAVTLANVGEHEKQRRWLDQEVESRLDGAGLLALLGTRVAPVDLYSTMREVEDADDELVYTYFSMPAVLDEGEGDAESWETLWPAMICKESSKGAALRCFNCLADNCVCAAPNLRWMKTKFSGARLRKIRRNEATWALVYQQQDVNEDATFNALAINASINSLRFPGPMTVEGMGHRAGGMAGLYVVGGLDPATTGFTSMMVKGVDRASGKRWVLDGYNNRNTTPEQMRDTVKRLTDIYKINEWVIERNAFQRFLTQDKELTTFLRARGCKLTEHYTTENKYDADFGIQAMAPLFLTCGEPPVNGGGREWKKTPDTALIDMPNPKQNAWVSEYINQLVTWAPSGLKQSHKTDLVMASWFCEIAINRVLGFGKKKQTHAHNPFASRRDIKSRFSISIADYKAAEAEAS